MVCLLKHIQGRFKNKLYLLSVVPKSIANKADVSSEFCWGKDKDDDHEQFPKLINSVCSNSRYGQSVLIFFYYHYLILIS